MNTSDSRRWWALTVGRVLPPPAGTVETTEPARDGGNRRPDIQGLRAMAVLMVVAFHAGLPVPGGFVGVDVFFVISGFVITAMLNREWVATGRIRFGAFYIRRFKRLTPALALMVAVTMVISVVVLSPFGIQQIAAETAGGAMLLVANFVIAIASGGYFDAPAATNPLVHTWSLSVEEQFYVAFPSILAVGWLLARRARVLRYAPFIIVGSVAAASFGLAVLGSTGFTLPRASWLLGFYSPLTRAWEFAVGALLALAGARLTITSRSFALALGLLGVGMLAASSWLITGTTPFPGVWALLPVAGALLLILAGTSGTNIISSAFATRPMVKIGDWSYSIYLWHWPLIVFAALLWPGEPAAIMVAVVLSFILAVTSYKLVEQPIRSLIPRSRMRFAGLIAATVLTPLAFAGMVWFGARAGWLIWTTASASGQSEQGQYDHVAMSRGCTDQPFDASVCTWNNGGANGKVLLVGDSQAYAHADGVIAAAAQLGMSTTVSSRSGCPFSTVDTTGGKPYDCPSWQQQLLKYALDTRPNVVVIANRGSGYTRPEIGWRTFIEKDGTVASVATATSLYQSGLNDVVKSLREAGIGVVIFQDIAEPDRLDQGTSILRLILPATGPNSFDPTTAIANRARAAKAEAAVASANPGTVLYDPIPTLCPSGECPLTIEGASLYLDTAHLTREGSLLLTRSLKEAIQQAAQERFEIAISDQGFPEWERERVRLSERGYPDRPPEMDTAIDMREARISLSSPAKTLVQSANSRLLVTIRAPLV